MRTTGVRSVPQVMPRPKQPPDVPDTKQSPDVPDTKQPPQAPQPLPRTKFLQKSASEESPSPVTLRSPPPPPVQSKCISPKNPTPPPKPPRTPSFQQSPSQDASPPRPPGLMEVLSRPSSAYPISPPTRTQQLPTPTLRPARPAPLGRGVPKRRTQRPSLQPLSLPPPPTSTPPRIPSSSHYDGLRVPSRPSAAQLAASSRTPVRVSNDRPVPSLTVGLRTDPSIQSPVCSVEDFEDSCKEVFRNTKTAKGLSASGKHMQAAGHFQKALTALDRVLGTQVLALSLHEPTRQRLFLLQQEVFSLRKEALNGFTDAQTAVQTPPGLAQTTVTPGAPPSYDDVLKEDNRRLRDDTPRSSSRELPTRGASSSPGHPPSAGRSSRPRPHPAPTQSTSIHRPSAHPHPAPTQPIPTHRPSAHPHPAPTQPTPTHRPSAHPHPAPTQPTSTHRPSTRVRSHSIGDSAVEELVDVRGTRSGEPTTAPPTAQLRSPHKSTVVSATRPKSSYHPTNKPNSLTLPSPVATYPASLPPPLVPVPLPPASLPTQPSGVKSLEIQPHSSSAADSGMDEVVLSQMRVLHKYENDKSLDVLADKSARAKKGPLPPLPLNKGNLQERKRKEKESSNGSDLPLPESSMKTSGSTVQLKDEAKNDPFPSVSPVDDPFLSVDPFPPIKPQSGDSDALFPKETLDAQSLPAASDTHHNHNQAPPDDLGPEASLTAHHKDSLSPNTTQDSLSPLMTQSSPDNLGDSILEALDFAFTPASDHKKVSPQHSRERRTARSYSEMNLLDTSHNTFEAILLSTKDRHASRASIIEEFDPLVTSPIPEDHNQDEEKREREVSKQKGKEAWREEETEVAGNSSPRPIPRAINSVVGADTQPPKRDGVRDSYGSPPDYYAEGGAVALEEEGRNDHYTSKRYSGAYGLSDGVKRGTSYSSEDSSSMYSWPPDYNARMLPDSASPVYPCVYPEEEEEEAGVDVGRSAFYLPPTVQRSEVKRRNLLSIREGVKIYFIHTDGIVTSPWKKPYLAVSKDPSKDQLFGTGLVVSVGSSLWVCELQRKATLVLRTQTGCYMFNEAAGKPECKAVAIRVPSGVRRAQHELLSTILQQNTLMEEERPKGITKVISKSATSAATRMTKIVEDQSVTSSQTFVRRNSMRALKGVTKHLTNIAEKTGGNLKELPEEYQTLQEAADTLAFALNAKMIQYV